MNSKHVSQSRRASARIFLFLSIMLAVPVGLQSGYAHEAFLHQTSSARTASPGSSQSLPPAKTAAARFSNPTSPLFCYQIAFDETDYTVGDNPLDVEVGEVNGDGIPDMLTVNYRLE